MYDPVSKVQTNLRFRTAYDNGGDVARICCDVTFTSHARTDVKNIDPVMRTAYLASRTLLARPSR